MLFGGAMMCGGNIVWCAKVVWCGSEVAKWCGAAAKWQSGVVLQ